MPTTLVHTKNLDKFFGKQQVLNKVDLVLEPGTMMALLGHNGAGKTTFMKTLLGLLKCDSGSVSVLGDQPGKHNHQVGYVPENVSFYPALTGTETLRFFVKLKGVKGSAINSLVNELLHRVDLWEFKDKPVKTYSKGMRQRLGLAQALIGEPRLLILDEPTVGLDPIATLEFFKLLKKQMANGCGILICTHVLPGLEKYLDAVTILHRGKVLVSGSVDALVSQASLPLTIQTQGLNGSLRETSGFQTYLHKTESTRLEVPPEEKLTVLKQLMQHPELQDVSVSTPSLPELYQHFFDQGERL